MNEKCLIAGHLGLGDLITINGLVRYYSKLYNNIYLLCKKENYKSIIQIYSDNSKIIPIFIDTNEHIISIDHNIFKIYKDCDIIKLGVLNNNWYVLKSNYTIGNLPYSFFETFYKQCNLEYSIRYEYEKINRNKIKEKNFYNKTMNKFHKYIFIHSNNLNLKISDEFITKNIPIFDPNNNYYDESSIYYNLWNNEISYNILDYCMILENAEELHLSFSSFFSLCMFLDLKNVKKKYIYTNITNIKDYHKNMYDWNIIYKNLK
jgi:hypothetical protein